MRRRDFLEAVGAGGALWFSGCGGRSRLAGTERKKPSFVFFLVDDLGWKDTAWISGISVALAVLVAVAGRFAAAALA